MPRKSLVRSSLHAGGPVVVARLQRTPRLELGAGARARVPFTPSASACAFKRSEDGHFARASHSTKRAQEQYALWQCCDWVQVYAYLLVV